VESHKREFGCHACIASLRGFIEAAEQAETLRSVGFQELAFKELKSAKELARIIAYASEDQGVEGQRQDKV
jgi:hypothetical protein